MAALVCAKYVFCTTSPTMKVSGVYCLVFPSGHYYYGQSKNIRQRYRDHINTMKRGCHDSPRVQNVYNLYRRPPSLRVECVADTSEIDAAEQIFLDEHVGKGLCLNIATDALATQRGRKRGPHSDAHKEYMRNLMKGRIFSDEHRRLISEAKKGKQQSPACQSEAARLKRSLSLKGRGPDEEHRKRISATLQGHVGAGRKRVFCITTGITYASAMTAEAETGFAAIGRACKKGFSAGKLPDGTKLYWRWADADE